MQTRAIIVVTAALLIGLGCGSSRSQGERVPPESSLKRELTVAELREWSAIVLHHTATETGSVESIDAEHRARRDAQGNPWKGIGYHFLIGNGRGMKDGEIVPTFRWKDQIDGAHAGNAQYNQTGIGICLVGNFEEAPPTEAQVKAARRLIAELQTLCDIEMPGIVRHGDVKATACPGKLFPWDQVVDRKLALTDGAAPGVRRKP